MKKIISYVLLLAMCLALFAGCAPKADNSGLESAKTYLYNMYKETNGSVTAVSYTRVGVVTIQNVGTYTVDWTVNSDAITVTPNENKMVSITIPDYPETEIAYTLTATIKDDKGNSVTVSFDYTVPAAAGQPASLADGTYVITNGKVTLSSLAESSSYGYPTGNEVTVADGKVTGHKAADVLTIKNVEGGVTVQDAYGRYFYLKGTYNSFNVDATAPAEGHIWEVLKSGDSFLLVNTMNKKTLAYSTSYSSWGAYPELTDDHSSALTIVAATAPSGGDSTETPSTGNALTGTKVSSIANGDKVIIFASLLNKAVGSNLSGSKLAAVDGTVSGDTLTASDAGVFEVKVDSNGYYSFLIGGKYLTSGETGNSVSLADAASAYSLWTLEETDGGYFVKNVNAKYGENAQYLEHYSGFTTYGKSSSADPKNYTFQFYKTEGSSSTGSTGSNNSTGNALTGTKVSSIANGDKVIIFASLLNKAVGSNLNGSKLAAVDGTVSGDTLTASDAGVFEVKVDSNGYYSFLIGGKYLTSGETGNSVSLADAASAYSLWTLEETDGGYFVKNVNAKYGENAQYLEHYSGFTTYGKSSSADLKNYTFQFYKAEGSN